MTIVTLPSISASEQRAHHRRAAELADLTIPEFVSADHRHWVLNGMRFHCLDWGTVGRPPVLFLHGGGQTARTWDLACLSLRPDFQCLALDQRGHGDSEWSYGFDYSPESHAADLALLLDALQIDRVTIVGMSMGCLNGLQLASSRPDRVAAFVAVDAGPWVRIEGARRIIDFVEEAGSADSFEAIIERVLEFNPRRDRALLRVSLRHNLRVLPDGRLTWKTDRRYPIDLQRMVDWLEGLKTRVANVSCPVLVLRGASSEVFLDEDAERFAAAVPDGRWTRIEGAGHTIQGDAPGALIRELRSFLERNISGR